MSPPPGRVCRAKQGLIADIRISMTAIIDLNNLAMERVIKGKPDATNTIEDELVEARRRRDSAMVAYDNHVLLHGC